MKLQNEKVSSKTLKTFINELNSTSAYWETSQKTAICIIVY